MVTTMINLTPYTIVLRGGTSHARTLEPSGKVARVQQQRIDEGEIDGIPVTRVEYGPIVGLPAPRRDTIYIAGSDVVRAAALRPDVFMLAGIRHPFDDEDWLDNTVYADGLEHS
jgi:hypothetical protein